MPTTAKSDKTGTNPFSNLTALALNVKKKGGLNYASWAESVELLFTHYPESEIITTQFPYQDDEGKFHEHIDVPYLVTPKGILIEVEVVLVDNNKRYSRKLSRFCLDKMRSKDLAKEADGVVIDYNLMRLKAKVIALHGAGLYVYQGEDIPDYKDSEGDGEKKKGTIPKSTPPAGSNGKSGAGKEKTNKKITRGQQTRLFSKATKLKWPETAIKSMIAKYGYDSSKDIEAKVDYPKIIEEIENGP